MLKKPDWLRVPYYNNKSSEQVTELIKELNLNTVCAEANCPNQTECFSKKTATFMILGTNCTRKCTFCSVSYGKPEPVDENEPERVAAAVKKLNLRYAVITSVTRDDLQDGGALHFSNVIKAIQKASPETVVEVLIPDLTEITAITEASPAVIGHNIETIEALYPDVRPEADYTRSLKVLKRVKELSTDIYTKSGLMLGLGESRDEILKTFDDLLDAGCNFLTLGQYLSPSKKHYPVKEYVEPKLFDEYKRVAEEKGFSYVASAPLVRSSYKAEEALTT